MCSHFHTDRENEQSEMRRLGICISHESMTKYFMTSCKIRGKTKEILVDLLKRRVFWQNVILFCFRSTYGEKVFLEKRWYNSG